MVNIALLLYIVLDVYSVIIKCLYAVENKKRKQKFTIELFLNFFFTFKLTLS